MNNLLSEINALYIRTNELQTFGVGIKTKEILKKAFGDQLSPTFFYLFRVTITF